MTTPGAWLILLAGVVFIAGAVFSLRQRRPRAGALAFVGTLALTGIVGWFAWLSTTVT